jgi:hypothetical protein
VDVELDDLARGDERGDALAVDRDVRHLLRGEPLGRLGAPALRVPRARDDEEVRAGRPSLARRIEIDEEPPVFEPTDEARPPRRGRRIVLRGDAMIRAPRFTALLLLSGLLAAPRVEGQWITLGRKALGKVKEMTQSEKTGGPGYSVATVLIAGAADKVFATAVRTVQANPKLRLTKQDAGKGSLEFADGKQVVGLAVSQVDEKTVHLLIASTATPGAPDETSAVAQAALRICRDAGTECSLAKGN